MAEGPLTESEMAWLEETLISYGHDDASVIDVSELDGMLTAVLSGPVVVEPDTWLVAVWGGEKYIPRWKNDREMNRFIDLCFKHMNDIAERLSEYPDQFEPMIPYMLSGRADRVSMFEFRKIIEVESIGLAAMRADIGQIDQMQAAYEAMAMAKSDELISRYDMQFHHLIAVATNNPVILRVFEIIQDTYLRPMLDQNVAVMGAYGAVYHEKMIRAVERRDVAQAKRLMEEHINNTIQMTAQLNR